MGRPKAKEPRGEQLNLSFTVHELEGIRQRAHSLGLRPSHFGRALLLKPHTSVTSERENGLYRLIHQQLIRIGNNLNQMVRHLHQTGDPLPADLEPLLNDIRALVARLAA